MINRKQGIYLKFVILLAVGSLFLSACKSTRQPLYVWDTYATDTYVVTNKQGDRSKLKQTYEVLIEKAQQSERKQVPPGIYAEYGVLLIELGEKEKGVLMLENEMNAYPESETYIRKIINTARL
ncbi:MAG: DUF4810 domain-containing protein [Tannerellaceae bacterium]